MSVSRNRGDSWERHLLPDTIPGWCHALAVAPSRREVIYAAGEVEDQGAVFRSTDIGHTWTQVSSPPEVVHDISVNPFDADDIYAAANHLYRTTDAGASWTRVDLPPQCVDLSCVRIHPALADSVVAAGRWGIVSTGDSRDWREMNEGLDEKHITFLEWADDGNCLVAATAGRACYGWAEFVGMSASPAPSAGRFPLTATVVRGALVLPISSFTIRYSLFSVSGRKAMDLTSGTNDVRRLAPGIYFVRVTDDAGRKADSKVLLVD